MNKKAEGVFGLSFSMIFSIILIIFFIIVAFIGIRALLNWQAESSIALFGQDLKNSVKEAFYAESTSFSFNRTLASGVEYVCFVNFSAPFSGNNVEKGIYDYMKERKHTFSNNVYIYSPKRLFEINYFKVDNIVFLRNPYCVKVKDKIISLKINKKFDENKVNIS